MLLLFLFVHLLLVVLQNALTDRGCNWDRPDHLNQLIYASSMTDISGFDH